MKAQRELRQKSPGLWIGLGVDSSSPSIAVSETTAVGRGVKIPSKALQCAGWRWHKTPATAICVGQDMGRGLTVMKWDGGHLEHRGEGEVLDLIGPGLTGCICGLTGVLAVTRPTRT